MPPDHVGLRGLRERGAACPQWHVALRYARGRIRSRRPGSGHGAWQRLEALPDPRFPQGRIYPLACLVAITLCAFTAAGNDRFTAVGQWIRRARRTWPGCGRRGIPSRAGSGCRICCEPDVTPAQQRSACAFGYEPSDISSRIERMSSREAFLLSDAPIRAS
jgi:DDE_Tnp_1-associated